MKRMRIAAFGLLVLWCVLAVAPTAQAGGVPDVPNRLALRSPGEVVVAFVVRVMERIGWGDVGPRPTTAAGKKTTDPGSKIPPPTTNADCGAGTDPNGTPCV